jgi:rubredoxin
MDDPRKLAKEGVCPVCGVEMDYFEDSPSGMSDPYYECTDCGRKFDALTGEEIEGR